MEKTYVLNYWWSANYGALLTAYALNSVLKDFGRNPWLVFNADKTTLGIESVYDFQQNFAKEQFNFTKRMKTFEDLKSLNEDSKTFVVGSDQVFRPIYNKSLWDSFLLGFAGDDAKRIAFSASFGVDKEQFLNENSKADVERLKNALNCFDYVSVREKSGVDLCREVFGVEAQVVIDPVFVVDRAKFDELIETESEEFDNKIVSYFLDGNEEKSKACLYLAKKYGCDVVELCNSNAPVGEWLRAVKQCKMLITDSFHGMCFAIIFNKPFICLANRERGFSRFESVLELLEIENKCVNSVEEMYSDSAFFEPDYERVNANIERQRTVALEFLNRALNGEGKNAEEKQRYQTLYLKDLAMELDRKASLKYQLRYEVWSFCAVVFNKYFPAFLKKWIRGLRARLGC